MIFLILLLGCSFAASQHVINPADFPKTSELTRDLFGVIGESNSLKSCITKVTSPIDKIISFADDVGEIDGKIQTIEGRVEVIVSVMEVVMLIPYVGEVAGFILEPAIAVLNFIKSGLAKVDSLVNKFAGLMHTWTSPLRTVQSTIKWVKTIIGKFTSIVYQINAKAAAAEVCVNSLPSGGPRNTGIHALEGVAGTLDVVPDGFNKVMGVVNSGCSKVEHFMHTLHIVRRRRGLPVLSTIKHVLDAIINALGPVGRFLDKVHDVLHKKFCLIHSLEQLGKGIVKVGEIVVNGAKHFVDEAGHVWLEVEAKTEHVIHEVGKGFEHVGTDIAHGAEHVANEIAHGAEHVANEIAHGAEHVANEVAHGAEQVAHEIVHVANEVAHGAEHVAHQVVNGVEHVGETIAKGAETVVHEIGSGVSTAVNKVGDFFHHLFGRRSLENVFLIDGKLYLLVDGSVDTRNRRGFDVCLSVSDILKGVEMVTGGLMGKAESLISGLFHGRSLFHIPGLTSDVLNIGSLFHNLNFGALLPSAADILKLPQTDIEKILKLNMQVFEEMMPECAAAFSKIHSSG